MRRSACSCKATILFGSRKLSGMSSMAGVLQWRDIQFSGAAGLYVREQLECIEFCLGTDRPTESLWVRIKEKINMGVVSAKATW